MLWIINCKYLQNIKYYTSQKFVSQMFLIYLQSKRMTSVSIY